MGRSERGRSATGSRVLVLLCASLTWVGCGKNDYDRAPRQGYLTGVPAVPNPMGAGVDPGVMPTATTAGVMGVEPPGTSPMAGTGAPSPVAGAGAAGVGTAGIGGAGVGGVQPPVSGEGFDAGTDPNRNQVQAGALCDRLATIQCAGEAHCCDNPGRDVTACKSAMLAICVDELLLDGISAQSNVGFDATRAAAAFTQFEALAANCDPSIIPFAERLDGLRGMFRGTVSAGQSCAPSNALNNTLAGAALVSCSQPETTACLPESALRWTCTARASANGDCFTDVNCQDGMYCDNPDLDIGGGPCLARKPLGAACSLPNECASWYCIGGSCAEPDRQEAFCLQ